MSQTHIPPSVPSAASAPTSCAHSTSSCTKTRRCLSETLTWASDRLALAPRLPGLTFSSNFNCSLCIAQVVSYTPRTYTSLHEQANLAAELYMASQLRNGKGQGRSTLHKAPALNICDPVIQRNPLISLAWSQTDMTCMALALGTLLPQPLEL